MDVEPIRHIKWVSIRTKFIHLNDHWYYITSIARTWAFSLSLFVSNVLQPNTEQTILFMN